MRPEATFIDQPIRSLQTMLRVISQEDDTLPIVIPDGIYGRLTEDAVKALQKRFGLPSNGITDHNTWSAVVAEYEDVIVRIGKAEPIIITMDPGETFTIGTRNGYIFLLQSILVQLSIDHDKILRPKHSGTFDDQTAASIRSFQELAGLPQTGDLDKITWKHLVKQFTLSARRGST